MQNFEPKDVLFPPTRLMERTCGLTSREDFEAHGEEILRALEAASPRPLTTYDSILDFGVGCGRLARMLPDFKGRYAGADIDVEALKWTSSNLRWVEPVLLLPCNPFPLRPGQFECIISISVFTNFNENDARFYLSELKRMTKPGANLFLTVHGERALERTRAEQRLADMLCLNSTALDYTASKLKRNGFHFVKLNDHLMSGAREYGTAFVGRKHIEAVWSNYFEVVEIRSGAIHDFQDIVVLRRPAR